MYLDDKQRDLVESIERGEWNCVSNLKAEIKKHQEYARNTFKRPCVAVRAPRAGVEWVPGTPMQYLPDIDFGKFLDLAFETGRKRASKSRKNPSVVPPPVIDRCCATIGR
jgi:hypothetical protein